MNILITTDSFGEYDTRPLDKLKSEGFDIILNPFGRELSKDESMSLYSDDIEGVIAGTEIIDAEIIKKASSLKVISRCGVGLDNIDLEAAKKAGIKVFNTPGLVTNAVAELTVGLIFACLRRIVEADRMMRQGEWKKPMGFLLEGKRMGIIGLGNIGKKVVELCSGLRVKFLAYDIKKDKIFADKHRVTYLDLDHLVSQSDIIIIHLPLTEETRNLINKDRINGMKQEAFLINTSRGNIVDEAALVKALREKKIAGAALDVFEKEPYQGPLTELDNVILTAHIGSYAREARVKMEGEAVENLIRGLKERRGEK